MKISKVLKLKLVKKSLIIISLILPLTAEKQSDLNEFVKKFLNEKGEVIDAVGYHKAFYAAENVDTIANHFYEQGKADAVKDVIAKSKNINNDPRPQASGDVFINGFKVKAISGVDSSRLKIKSKKQTITKINKT